MLLKCTSQAKEQRVVVAFLSLNVASYVNDGLRAVADEHISSHRMKIKFKRTQCIANNEEFKRSNMQVKY